MRDTREGPMQFIETLDAVEELLKDQNLPAAANDGKR
jgi:hypothetical protein